MPRVACGQQVVCPARRLPRLEGTDLDRHTVTPGYRGHPVVGLYPEHGESAIQEGHGHLAGPASDIESIRLIPRHQFIEQGGWIAGPVTVVALGDRPERLRSITLAVQSIQGHFSILRSANAACFWRPPFSSDVAGPGRIDGRAARHPYRDRVSTANARSSSVMWNHDVAHRWMVVRRPTSAPVFETGVDGRACAHLLGTPGRSRRQRRRRRPRTAPLKSRSRSSSDL